jgi:hypothetical protein
MIIVGQLTDSLGACCYVEAVAVTDPYLKRYRNFDVRARYELEESDVRSIRAGCPVTDRHRGGRQLGEVMHAETVANGDTHVVCDMRSLDVPSDPDGYLYFSLEGNARDGGIDVHRIVLTGRPATVGLKPIKLLDAGTVRDVGDVVWLRMRSRDPFTAGLLERSRAAVRARRPSDPILHRARHLHRDDAPPRFGWVGPDGRPVDLGIRHGPPGYVISVR